MDILVPRDVRHATLLFALLLCAFAALYVLLQVTVGQLLQDTPALRFLVGVASAAPFIGVLLFLLLGQVRSRNALQALADTDGLTGLLNRRAFFSRIEAGGLEGGGVLILLDVDHFKDVNDFFGHQTGDKCLQSVARLIAGTTPNDGYVARLGGEEFAVALPRDAEAEVPHLLETWTAGVHVPTTEGVSEHEITLSAGVSFLCRPQDLGDAMQAADEALYDAKASGRAQAQWAGATLGQPARMA